MRTKKNQFATLCVEVNSLKSWAKMKTLRDAYHSRHDIDAFSWLMGHWLDSPFFVCEMCAKRKIDTWFREKISAALLFETCSFEMSYDEAFRYQLSFNCLWVMCLGKWIFLGFPKGICLIFVWNHCYLVDVIWHYYRLLFEPYLDRTCAASFFVWRCQIVFDARAQKSVTNLQANIGNSIEMSSTIHLQGYL